MAYEGSKAEESSESSSWEGMEDLGTDINSYKLPITDVQEKRRNFSGYQVAQPYSLADIQQGDTSGTTETDSATDPSDKGYTKINQKKGRSVL